MVVKIIASLLIIAFFWLFYKAGDAFLEKGNLLSMIFPIASTLMAGFLIGLMFLG